MTAAGWYPDPADPSKERWWGGVEWTHTVRDLVAAPVAAPQPPLLNVPGGGVNPFAEQDAHEARMRALNPEPEPVVVRSFGYSSGPQQQFGMGLGMEPPANGIATAGLVLSALCISTFGAILSFMALRRANAFARSGLAPVGRKRAIWGIALAFLMPIVVVGASLGGYGVFRTQQIAEVAQREGVPSSAVVIDQATGLPLRYDRQEAEDVLYEMFAEEGMSIQSVGCPDTATMVVGGGFECTFTFDGRNHAVGFIWTSNAGEPIVMLDGVQVQN